MWWWICQDVHVVGDVRAQHPRLDAGGLDDVPDRLIVPVEVVREPDEIEAGIAGARALPVDDPGEGASSPARSRRRPVADR